MSHPLARVRGVTTWMGKANARAELLKLGLISIDDTLSGVILTRSVTPS
jgi:hypothetical protein